MNHTSSKSHTNGLPDCIQVVGDLEVRQVFAYFLRHFLWSEAHGSYVVGAQGELALWSLHELQCCAVAVRDVHHGKTCFGAQVALVVACAQSIVEDLDRIVCVSTERGECMVSAVPVVV